MAAGAALLFATLIGVFITPDGIVVGADSALSDPSGPVASQQKYCVTGPRSVATLQGAYELQDTLTNATTRLFDRFRELCDRMGGAPSPMTLREQAERIASALKDDLVAFLEDLPAAEVARMYSTARVVARIAATGYSERGPESVVVGIGVATDGATKRWEAQVQPLPRLTFSDCGVRFHGQESVVATLGTDKGLRVLPAELQNRDVTRLSALLKGSCTEASIQSAPSMFVQAVRLTIMQGPGFGIPKGSVSPPLDVVVIPRDGAIEVKRIDSW
ncbi:MAG TPA: hypothetical protein VFO67_03860 [Gemmatimonadales bacterium]|nr:hypothetical protein [Gemmatimonadales bacterium]